MQNKLFMLLTVLLLPLGAWADIACDGGDDDLRTNLAFTTFVTSTTGTVMLWYTPTGAADTSAGQLCTNVGIVWAAYEPTQGAWLGITRHGNFGGADRLLAFHWDGATDCIQTPYTANVPTHLAWVHGLGSLSLYKDGVLVQTIASGATADLSATIHLHFCVGIAFESDELALAQGTFAGIQTFPTALTTAEIAAHASARLHFFGASAPSGAWALDSCATTGDGVIFHDRSGNGRALTGNNGPDNLGLTCLPNTMVMYPWGVE